ncbi:transposase [Nonomuraea sp. NPDC049400]|uniref:transposase n=1 Tax=Nonomuraea sp. NPDC049400 TaxID=3364352 RepID=UPI0037ABF2F7
MPTAGRIDSQTVKAAESVGAAVCGFDGGKKIKGQKRYIAVDTLGLLLCVIVTAASVQDRDGAGGWWCRNQRGPGPRRFWHGGMAGFRAVGVRATGARELLSPAAHARQPGRSVPLGAHPPPSPLSSRSRPRPFPCQFASESIGGGLVTCRGP